MGTRSLLLSSFILLSAYYGLLRFSYSLYSSLPHYSLLPKVLGLMYDSAGRTATLTVAGPNGEREEGPFDLVIFASQASEPNIPEIPGIDQFGGKVLHTTQFKREEFDEIVAERKKVSCSVTRRVQAPRAHPPTTHG